MKNDAHAAIEIGEFAQASRQGLIIEDDAGTEDLNIGLEANRRAGAIAGLGLGDQGADRIAPLKALAVHLVLAIDRDLDPFR